MLLCKFTSQHHCWVFSP